MKQFRMTAAPLILLGSSQILVQDVSLVVSFYLHYFSSPPGRFMLKELSQTVAPIPGGSHGTTFEPLPLLYFCSDRDENWCSYTM
jgi:hypothetical protein